MAGEGHGILRQTKRTMLITLAMLAALAPLPAAAGEVSFKASGEVTYNVLLAGGDESNEMKIWLTPDGRTYVIDSIVPLEVGGTVCANASGNPNELICQAVNVAAFEVNAGGGDDRVKVATEVKVPVAMRGGPGRDALVGGSGPDKLFGGPLGDKLIGNDGDDVLIGGDGYDALFGGNGDDVLKGGPGPDNVLGGPGRNQVQQDD